MSTNLENKKVLVAELSKSLKNTGSTEGSVSAAIFNYSALNVNEINDLRAKLFELGASLRVVKNTLIKRAFDEVKTPLEAELEGQNAVLLIESEDKKDLIAPLKVLFDFIKANEKGAIALGILNGAILTKDKVEQLSKLPSREVLLAQVVGGLASPIRSFEYTLNGVQSQFVRALQAVKESKE